MQLSADSIRSARVPDERRCEIPSAQFWRLSESYSKPWFHLRGVIWSLVLSTIFWVSLIFAGRGLSIW